MTRGTAVAPIGIRTGSIRIASGKKGSAFGVAKSEKNHLQKSLKIQFLGDFFVFGFDMFLAKQSLNNIDNPIDNGWISILQQIEIQSFIFYYLCGLIDKAS